MKTSKLIFVAAMILAVTSFKAYGADTTRDLTIGAPGGGMLTSESVYHDSWALLIAIDDYQQVPKLNYAVADAESMKDYLINVDGFKSSNVFTLYNEEATKPAMETALGTLLPSKVGKEDRVLIFFAGHGQTETLPDGSKMGFLIPYEGQATNLYGSCLSMSSVKEISRRISSKHIFFAVDACYSGIAGYETRAVPSADPAMYLKKLTSMRAVQIVTAGQGNETVIESERFGGGHSVFSYHMVKGLTNGAADLNGDGIIPASELYAYLAPRITNDSDGHQTPKLFNMDGDGEFVFFTEPIARPASFGGPVNGDSIAPKYPAPGPTNLALAPIKSPKPEASRSLGIDNFILVLDQSKVMHLNYNNQSLNYLVRKIAKSIIENIPEDSGVKGAIYMYGIKNSEDKHKVMRVQGLDDFEIRMFKDALKEVDKQNGPVSLDLAFAKVNGDLTKHGGRTAIIVISGGDLGKGQSALQEAEKLKEAHGDNICIYTIQVGNSRPGEKNMNKLVEIGQCGFSSDGDSLQTDISVQKFIEILD